MEEDACHFEVVDGEELVRNGVKHRLGPGKTPDAGAKGGAGRKPDASGAVETSIAIAKIVGRARHKLRAVGGTLAQDFEHGAKVGEGFGLGGATVDVHSGLVVVEGHVESAMERTQQCGAPWDAQGRMLAFANEGLEGFDVQGLFVEQSGGGVGQGLQFARGEFHGAVDAVEDPA